ncbi:MAG: hypothetical protein ACFFCM_02330 [Promethearchaeota archaeon]
MKEIELVDRFCEFLERQNLRYKRELWRGSHFNEGYVDLVIFDGEFIGIEAKLNNFKSVLTQAWINTLYFPLSYILYSKSPTRYNKMELKKTTIGLIVPQGKGFKILRKPRLNKTCFYDIIKRNWDENRVGRKILNSEIPENYNIEKIKELECTYDWLKSKFELDLKNKIQKRIIDFLDDRRIEK